MVRCSECKKNIVSETKYMDWLALINFIEFLFNEQYIEEVTYNSMLDKLMTLKDFAVEGE